MSLTLKGFDFAFYCILLYFILLHYLMYHKITNIDSSSNNTDYYKFYSFPLSSFMPTFLYHIQLMCFFFTMPLYFFQISIDSLIQYVFIEARGKEEIGRDDGVARDIFKDFRLMFQTVSSLVRKKEYHLFAMTCARRNWKQLEKYQQKDL